MGRGGGDEGIGTAVRGEVEGNGGVAEGMGEVGDVGPEKEGRPVGNSVGDDAGFVWRDIITKEMKWRWR